MKREDREKRNEKIVRLYFERHLSVIEIGSISNLHFGTVARIIRTRLLLNCDKKKYSRGRLRTKECPVCGIVFNDLVKTYCSKKCYGISVTKYTDEERKQNNRMRVKSWYDKHKNLESFKLLTKQRNDRYKKLLTV
jgi:endogenous inhibitor of DNA gyrase (YacG/DUF329 family)